MKPGDVALTAESEAELANLHRALARSTGFAVYLVLADGPARAEELSRLRAWSGQDGIPALAFLPGGKDAGAAVMDLLNGKGAPFAGVVIPDGDSVVRDEVALASLNTARDRLYEWIEGPLLIVLAPRNEVELSRAAPDFFDIRAATYTITAEVEPPRPEHEVFLVHELPARRGPVKEEEELRALEAAEEPPLPSALADAWLDLATSRRDRYDWTGAAGAAAEALRFARPIHYWRVVGRAAWVMAYGLYHTGRLQQAEEVLAEAIDATTRAGDALQAAKVKVLRGEILQLRGELNEALRIYREEVLPVFERLGDVHSRAVTLGKVTDILEVMGELDEALRIRRDEELPVYERLGDVRSRAVTLGKVADILQARGELDEALRILREETLPAFERLGDEHERAISLVNIADILQARSEFDEALRILREDALPVFERLGDLRSLLVGRTRLVHTLENRGRPELDGPEIRELLALALKDARRLSLPEARIIEDRVRQRGLDPDAPPFV